MEKPTESYTDLHPTYQIDFSAEDVGKRFAASKREIRWRFGFPNQQALNSGVTGPACRGEEHEVVVLWSITSGKKVVILNNQEIHNSTGRVNTFYHSFIIRGRHVVKLEANLTKHENLPQYDLQIDGVSFSKMPKVFQLGIRGSMPNDRQGPPMSERTERPAHPPAGRQYDYVRGQYTQPPSSSLQEEEDLRQAIARSLEDSRNHLAAKGKDVPPRVEAPPATAPKQPDLLIDFFSDPIPTTQPAPQPATASTGDLFSAPASAAPVYGNPFQMNTTQYTAQTQPSYYAGTSFTPSAAENPFAAAPTVQNTYSSPAPYNIAGSNPFADNPYSPPPVQQQPMMNGGNVNYQPVAPAATTHYGYPHQGQGPASAPQYQYQQYGHGYQYPTASPNLNATPGSMQPYSAHPGQNQQYGNYQF